MSQTHRYFTISHKMKRIDPLVNGSYLNAKTQKLALDSPNELPIQTEVKEVKELQNPN